ncbi:MAG: DUF4391 domain-containing protein [Saprospiraceae bacterium]|uniref:DUF4391 domain-containing protein n=1 Tax=Candidatus Opimibacter skivensis TaxID=2982028 RepID=A0A9D7SYU8_9BACT|nr:DUF4391 domain-containing protein [Candidatus Opimibacter skivensis]
MEVFNLPQTTKVGRVVPKNAFDSYATAKQRKLFTDRVQRITWTHKLSPGTTNLESKEIKEIQVFKVELKSQETIDPLLAIIDRAIPYNIIFIVTYTSNMYLSTSVKHPHPVNEDNTVVDWTFKTDWFVSEENRYTMVLKKSLDSVYLDFCIQLSGRPELAKKSLLEFVEQSRLIDSLTKEVSQLKAAIANCKQFNQKVELNVKLMKVESQLYSVLNGRKVY